MPKKILLADDSITIQKVITITFAAEDYDLVIAGDGDSAIKKVKEVKPDLIMADVAMPGKTGYEVCESVKNDPALRNIPVLLLAGTFEPLNKDEAKRVKADDSIIKPFESQELLDKVKELLTRAASRSHEETIPEAAPTLSSNAWEAGDFLGFQESFEEKPEIKDGGYAVDLDFLESGGLFEEPHKDTALPDEKEFLGLDFNEHDFSLGGDANAEPAQASPPAPKLEDIRAQEEKAPEKTFEPLDSTFDVGPFDVSVPPRTEFKPEPFEVEPLKPENFDINSLWAPEAVEEKKPPVQSSEPLEPFREKPRVETPPAPPVSPERGTEKEAQTEPKVFKPEFESGIFESEPVVFKEEPEIFRIEPEPLKPEEIRPESFKTEAFKPEPLKAQTLNLEREPEIAEPVMEKVTAQAGERLKERLEDRFGGSPLPKEQIEAIVTRMAKQVIEEVAWEVVPELAEGIIKAEVERFKAAFSKSR